MLADQAVPEPVGAAVEGGNFFITEQKHLLKTIMDKPKHHIFVCASFRAQGTPQGICHKKESLSLIPYLESELSDRGMTDVAVSATGCLNICEKGPVVVVYPENFWYGEIDSEDKIDEILDALEEGESAEAHLIS
jgi:(2Fe-2S) ferredoxin